MEWRLAQVNIGRLRAPIDDPLIAEFKNALEEINALAERSPGFVWRLQTEGGGDATGLHPTGEELVIPNMSVWESVDELADFVFRSAHTPFLRRRGDWFERYGSSYVALWWIPAEHIPTLDEALERLGIVEERGPTPDAFTFAHRFPAPDTAALAS
jgi:hypothetical protein